MLEPPQLMWEHSGKCLCGKRSYLFSQCRSCLEEEAREREVFRQEERFGETEWSRPGSSSDKPAPGATDIIDDEELEDAVVAASLPSVLPCPRVRKGVETSAVVFVTDAVLHSFIASRGRLTPPSIRFNREGWARVVKFDVWHPGRDFEVPTLMGRQWGRDQAADAPYRISFVLTSNASRSLSPAVIPLQQCVRQTAEDQGAMMYSSEPVWFRKPADLVGFFEPTPVSKQLDA